MRRRPKEMENEKGGGWWGAYARCFRSPYLRIERWGPPVGGFCFISLALSPFPSILGAQVHSQMFITAEENE